jgi:hypothetical protein
MPAGHPPISESCGAKATKRDTTILNKTKIALAAALVIGTASTALAAAYLEPGSIYNAPMGGPNAFPPCFDAAGQWVLACQQRLLPHCQQRLWFRPVDDPPQASFTALSGSIWPNATRTPPRFNRSFEGEETQPLHRWGRSEEHKDSLSALHLA